MAGKGAIWVVVLIVPHRAKKLIGSLEGMRSSVPDSVESGRVLYASGERVSVECMVSFRHTHAAAAAVTLLTARAPRSSTATTAPRPLDPPLPSMKPASNDDSELISELASRPSHALYIPSYSPNGMVN